MSKKNNVNPNHYKTKGSTRPGDDILQENYKQKLNQMDAQQRLGRAAPHLNDDETQPLDEELEQDNIGEVMDSAQTKK